MSSNNNKSDNTEVLSYKIDTAEFDKGMDKLIAALEKVEKREYLTQLQNSIDGISTGVNTMNFSNMEQGLTTIEARFSTMGVIGMSVINNLTNAVTNFVQQFVIDKMLGDAINGFQELNIQINSTQTILSNTSSRFGTTLKDVNKGLDILNDYADKTIYNFSNMTQAVGAFTSAGINLDTSIQAIKGVANMAAYAGAGAEAAASGMYQFSNSLNLGYMMLYQWRSLMYSGLGTKALEDEMISSARGMGIEVDAIIKEYGSFQYSLESGWATKEVILHTLAKFAGEVTEDQLRAMKYTEDEIKRIIELGKTATDAATKVVSYEKLVTSLSEAVGSGWARTFRLIIGDFEEGKKLFTMISDNLLEVIKRGADNRNKLAEDWAKFGGRDVVVESIDKLLKTYSQLLLVVGNALNEIFPPITGKMLADGTKSLGKLVDLLIPTQKGLDNIGRVIRGFAATIDIPLEFFRALGRYLYDIIRPMLNFKTTWTDSVVSFADFMTKLRNEIVKGDLFYKKITEWGNGFKLFVDKIKKFLDEVGKLDAVKKMKAVFDAITLRFGIKDPAFLSKFLSDAQKSFSTFFSSLKVSSALETLNKFILGVIGFGKDVYKFFEPAITYVIELVGNFAKAFGLAVKDLSTNFTWDKFKDVLGILAKFLTLGTITKVIERFGFAAEIFMKIGMGFGETIGYIGNALKQFVNSNDADTLLSISIAIGILSASVFMLATLPQKDIDKGIKAITTIYAGLSVSLIALNAILNGPNNLTSMAGSALKLALLPPVLIALAAAVAIMGYALSKIGALPMKQIIKGLGSIVAIMGALQIFMIVDRKLGGMSLTSGLGMIAMAVSLTVLAKAISMFSDIKLDTMGRAALAVGGLLLMVGLLSKAKGIGPQMLLLGASITGIAASLAVLALSFKYLGSIDFSTIATGLTNVLVMLGAVYFASFVGRRITALGIAKLALTAVAIAGLGLAFLLIAKIDAQKVILASTAVGLGIGILYGVVSLIDPSIVDNVAGLAILSAGIALFALSLLAFKNVDFKAVALGGAALGVLILALIALGALSIAVPLLAPAITAIAAVLLIAGAAFMMFGASVLFAGAGFKLLAEGLVMLANSSTKMLESFIKNIPKVGEAITQFVTVMATTIVKVLPQLVAIGTTIVAAICTAMIAATPYITNAVIVIGSAILDTLTVLGPKLNNTMAVLLVSALTSLEKNIGTYVTLWNRIVTKMFNAGARTVGPVVDALYNYIIAFVRAAREAVEKRGPELGTELAGLASALFRFFVESMFTAVDTLDEGAKWFVSYVQAQMSKETIDRLKDFAAIGKYVVTGIIIGLLDPLGLLNLGNAVSVLVAMMLDKLRNGLETHSPSKKSFEIADYYMQGLVNGLDPSLITKKLNTVKDAMLSFMDGSLSNSLNFQPVLSPVLDMGAMSAIEKTISSAFGPQQFNPGIVPGHSLYSSPVGLIAPGPREPQTVYNQYNTSPSPLSVEEVARRTASLIGQNRR